MVKDFSLCINPYFHRNLREVQAEIPILIKLVNEKVMGVQKSKVSELSYDGFVEYLLQHAHQYFNVHRNLFENHEFMTAAELSKALVSAIRDVNDKKNLRLNQRYFDEAGTTNPQEKQLIELLNQKVYEDKNFKLPDGFKKVQDYQIAKDYVPDPKWSESKRIASEVLEELMLQ